jgi:signal transduction histidine kinase
MDSEGSLSSIEQFRRVKRLLEISRSMCVSLELEPFLHSLIAAAGELTDSETASILILDESKEQLRFLALPWFHRDRLKSIKVPLQTSIAGWAFESGKPAIIHDTATEPRHFKGADQAADFITLSLMAIPIIFQGEKLGVFEVVNKSGNAHYTEEDLTILETLAAHAAISIQNSRLLDEVKKSQEQMARLDLMKSDFIAITSHELRTPLGLILGHATFLREVIQPEQQAQVDTIMRNAMRLKNIIDSVANMDNAQRGTASLRAQMVSIKQVVEEIITEFAPEAHAKNVTLRSELGQGELLLESDVAKISIAISNVVKNALDFTDPGGNVLIVADQFPEYIKLSVIDDGIGIPAKDLAHIFERFYQVESHLTRKHAGMGLGLSVTKVMTEMHGGRVWAESVEGKGSNFTFILPVNPSQSQPRDRVVAS